MKSVVLVHGGAAVVAPDRVHGKMRGVKVAAHKGYTVLQNGGSAVDAVEAAVQCMEDNEYFNAGFGAVLNLDGEAEMDASIMDGNTLSAGAVAVVKDVKNPVSLARSVMETTPHVLIAANGTTKFAQEQGIPIVPNSTLVSNYSRHVLKEFLRNGSLPEDIGEKGGTVGAVACDENGNVAAATSTGGVNGQMVGRIGDTPQIGSGTYADNSVGAVSCTGHGESILKTCLAHSIIKQMERGTPAFDATVLQIQRMTERLKKKGGAITVSNKGKVGFHFSTVQMPWAYEKSGNLHFGLVPGEHSIISADQLEPDNPMQENSSCDCL